MLIDVLSITCNNSRMNGPEQTDTIPEKPRRGRPSRPAPASAGYVHVAAYLPPAIVKALDEEASAAGLPSRSEVIRRACVDYLRRRERRRARGEDPDD